MRPLGSCPRRDRGARRPRCPGAQRLPPAHWASSRPMQPFISSSLAPQRALKSMPAAPMASNRSCLADAWPANSWRNEKSGAADPRPPPSARAVLDQVLEARHDDRLEKVLFGREMAVDGPHADAGPFGDPVDRHRNAFGREDRLGCFEDALAVSDGVRPHVPCLGGWSCHRPGSAAGALDKRNVRSV